MTLMKSSAENAARIRSIDYLVVNHRVLAFAAVFLLTLAAISLVMAAIVPSLFGGSGPAEKVAVVALGGVIAVGLLLMLATSFLVIKHRAELLDWGSYLAIIWLLPYFGIAIYLGGAAVARKVWRQ
jgi:hypothetical protein